MNSFLALLRRDQRAVAAVEMAMIAPIFATLVLGAADLANGFAKRVVLEQAANRVVQLGDVVRPETDADVAHLKAEAVAATGVPEGNVAVDVYLLCNRQKKAYDEECASGQVGERHVSVRITAVYKPVFHFISKNWSTPAGVVLTGAADSRIQ